MGNIFFFGRELQRWPERGNSRPKKKMFPMALLQLSSLYTGRSLYGPLHWNTPTSCRTPWHRRCCPRNQAHKLGGTLLPDKRTVSQYTSYQIRKHSCPCTPLSPNP